MIVLKGAVIVICCILNTLAVTMDDYPEDARQIMQQLHDACIAKSGVTQEMFALGAKKEFPEDQALKCYMHCLLDELAVIDEDTGLIDIESYVGLLPDVVKGKWKPVMENCGTQPGADRCDSIFNTFKCWYEKDPDLYVLF
uniref:Pheromone-binding protein 5 n=1 Tax=Rhyzopertha dominica TaxID=92692 RepID=A0A0X8RDP5_RHYDO|nr:pheromone-binding protein 5 [Rhyzopertha dominica]